MAKSTRTYSVLPADLPELSLPYSAVESRFGEAASQIADRLAKSAASDDIKNAPLKTGRWGLAWEFEEPPKTTDYKKYLEHLQKTTTVYLFIRINRWKGHAQLHEVPPQVQIKLEERARLKCSAREGMTLGDVPETSVTASTGVSDKAAQNSQIAIKASTLTLLTCVNCRKNWLMNNPSEPPAPLWCPWCGTRSR